AGASSNLFLRTSHNATGIRGGGGGGGGGGAICRCGCGDMSCCHWKCCGGEECCDCTCCEEANS
ncbi:unnamed protein product, partial [Rotaria sp. Silwood1]